MAWTRWVARPPSADFVPLPQILQICTFQLGQHKHSIPWQLGSIG